MADFRLIQNKYGNVYRYVGDVLPDGCQWMPPDMGPCRILGVWKNEALKVEAQQEKTTGERKVPCSVFSRVVGYISVVKTGKKPHWNKGKFEEFKERATYNLDKALGGNG